MSPEPTAEAVEEHMRAVHWRFYDTGELPTTPAPAGQVIVHNRVKPREDMTECRQSENGFRGWLQDPEPDLEACDCGWAPWLGDHYRVPWRGA